MVINMDKDSYKDFFASYADGITEIVNDARENGKLNKVKLRKELEVVTDHAPENFTGDDFLELALDGENPYLYLSLYRLAFQKRVVIDRSREPGKSFLKILLQKCKLERQQSEERDEDDEDDRIRAAEKARMLLSFNSIEKIVGECAEEFQDGIPKEVRWVLDMDDLAVLHVCMETGYLCKEYADEYIQYAMQYGKSRLIPYLIKFKFQ